MLVRVCLIIVLLTLPGCFHAEPAAKQSPSDRPERIVSLVPSVTELIHSVGASERIVGVTLNDDYPDSIKDLPKVGDQTIDLEKVLSLEPDLVIFDSNFNKDKQALEKLGLKTLELRCERLQDVPIALTKLGHALGVPERGEAEARAFREGLAKIQPLNLDKTLFVEVWGSPLMTVGSQTLVNDLLSLSGLKNSYADQEGYFQVDPEDVLSRNPDIIVVPRPASSTESESQAFLLLKRAGQNPQVVEIDPDLLIRPGPRLLRGIDLLQNQLKSTH